MTLALSLHAPNDTVRKELMPIANKYHIQDVLAACKKYFEVTGRRVTFEYSLVAGVNDNEDEARQLAALLNGFPCHVNLIPVNPIKERNYVQSGQVQIEKFKKLLEKVQYMLLLEEKWAVTLTAHADNSEKAILNNIHKRSFWNAD